MSVRGVTLGRVPAYGAPTREQLNALMAEVELQGRMHTLPPLAIRRDVTGVQLWVDQGGLVNDLGQLEWTFIENVTFEGDTVTFTDVDVRYDGGTIETTNVAIEITGGTVDVTNVDVDFINVDINIDANSTVVILTIVDITGGELILPTAEPDTPEEGHIWVDGGDLYFYDGSNPVNVSDGLSSGATEGTISATGTTQGTAASLTHYGTTVTGGTLATNEGVILTGGAGSFFAILHVGGAFTLKVYPPSGAQIDALAVDSPDTLASGGRGTWTRISSTRWTRVS